MIASGGIGGQILIRNIDDEVVGRLKTRAKLAGMSLESFLLERLIALAPLGSEEKIALIEQFHRKHGPLALATAPEDVVRDERTILASPEST